MRPLALASRTSVRPSGVVPILMHVIVPRPDPGFERDLDLLDRDAAEVAAERR